MDRETIIKLAREAGLIDFRDALSSYYVQAALDDLERFAKLVAEHRDKWWEEQVKVEVHEAVLEEREVCAKVCDVADSFVHPANLAREIRARTKE